MRTNFYELLSKREFNARAEYDSLWHLLMTENNVVLNSYYRPLSAYIDACYFRELACRGSFTNLSELMKAVGLDEYHTVDIDHLLLFCEFLVAVLPEDMAKKHFRIEDQRNTILGNIHYILEQTNHEFIVNADGNWIIVEKNKAATLAAELVEEKTIAFDIIEYNHFALKGHLDEKRKILVSIAAYVEPILKSRSLSKAGYKQLESDAGFIFNNFHIRHNNKSGPKAQDYIINLSDNELEEWYDKAYEIALSVIIINDCLTIGAELSELKTKYTWRT